MSWQVADVSCVKKKSTHAPYDRFSSPCERNHQQRSAVNRSRSWCWTGEETAVRRKCCVTTARRRVVPLKPAPPAYDHASSTQTNKHDRAHVPCAYGSRPTRMHTNTPTVWINAKGCAQSRATAMCRYSLGSRVASSVMGSARAADSSRRLRNLIVAIEDV